MIGKIKTYALAGLAILASIFYALFRSQQALRAKEKLKGQVQARKTEAKAADAMVEGLEKEREVKNAKVNTTKRDHFSK